MDLRGWNSSSQVIPMADFEFPDDIAGFSIKCLCLNFAIPNQLGAPQLRFQRLPEPTDFRGEIAQRIQQFRVTHLIPSCARLGICGDHRHDISGCLASYIAQMAGWDGRAAGTCHTRGRASDLLVRCRGIRESLADSRVRVMLRTC